MKANESLVSFNQGNFRSFQWVYWFHCLQNRKIRKAVSPKVGKLQKLIGAKLLLLPVRQSMSGVLRPVSVMISKTIKQALSLFPSGFNFDSHLINTGSDQWQQRRFTPSLSSVASDTNHTLPSWQKFVFHLSAEYNVWATRPQVAWWLALAEGIS